MLAMGGWWDWATLAGQSALEYATDVAVVPVAAVMSGGALRPDQVRYIMRRGVDGAGHDIAHVYDTAQNKLVDTIYPPSNYPDDVPVVPPVVPSGGYEGAVTDPYAADKVITSTWRQQQGATQDFFDRVNEGLIEQKKSDDFRGLLIWAAVAVGGVLVVKQLTR